jgi:hypothetical protein
MEEHGLRWTQKTTPADSAQLIPERHVEGVKMARRNRSGTIVTALAVLGIILAGGREAAADLLVSGGIVRVGGVGQGPDPQYTYQFQVGLTGTIDANSFLAFNPAVATSFTIDNLAGISPFTGPAPFTSTTSTDQVPGGAAWVPALSPGSITGTTDVTWTYLGPQLSSTTGPLLLGTFTLDSDYALTVTPTLNTTYVTSLDGAPPIAGNPLTFAPEGIGALAFVPEPPTAIAPLIVLLGLPFVMLLKRRARRGSPQAV